MTSNLILASHIYIQSMYSLKREEISTEYELKEIAFSNLYPIKCLLHLVDLRTKQSYTFEISVFDENGPKAQMREIDMKEYLSETKENDKFIVVHPMYYMEVSIGYHFDMSTGNMNYFIYSDKLNGITRYGEFSIDLNQYYQKSVWKLQDHRFSIGTDEYALFPWNAGFFISIIQSGYIPYHTPKSLIEDTSLYTVEFCEIGADGLLHYGFRPSLLSIINSGKSFSFPKYESSIYELIRNNPIPDDRTLVSVMHDYTKTSDDDKFNVIYTFASYIET